LKAKLCVEANPVLYEMCEKHRIPFDRLGKLTVAIGEEEIAELEKLMKWGTQNGVQGLRFMDGEEVKKLEPNVNVERALLSPSTGIVDADELMSHYYAEAYKNGAVLSTQTEVTSISKGSEGYDIKGMSQAEPFNIRTETVVNCAGLYADRISEMVGIDVDQAGYRLHLCKGDYYRLVGKSPIKRLVYPLPKGGGLGIHLTPDLAGTIRLGPNSYYVDKIDYLVESGEKEFREDVKKYVPRIVEHELVPDFAGVRPKLQGPKDGFRDFAIRNEADKGLDGFINLVGIESPGLTSAPSIARLVAEIYANEVK
jgi:L-2-hydroxyglutarate oxidase LhgO